MLSPSEIMNHKFKKVRGRKKKRVALLVEWSRKNHKHTKREEMIKKESPFAHD